MKKRSPLALNAICSALVLWGVSSLAYAADGIVSGGVDSTASVVFNVLSEGPGSTTPPIFAVVVGTKYEGYSGQIGDCLATPANSRCYFGAEPGTQAQFQINPDSVQMNRNTYIANEGTFGVSGATTLQSTLGVSGATTISNSLAVNTADTGPGARLFVSSTANRAYLQTTSGQGISVDGTTTQIKGGTHSGILTLQDGDTTGGGVPNGTSITISGSGGGTAATVFQTTTNANTTSVTTAIGTSAVYSLGSTAVLQAGPTNAVTVNSGNLGANPGVSINGVVGGSSTSTTGVLITGSGQNSQPYTTADRAAGTMPTWADVAIQSKSYGAGDPALGSAILITDYGIQMISPQPIAGQQIVNNTGINNSTGSIVNNNGMNTSSGSVTNNTGGNSGSGSATNNIGMNSSSTGGTVANNIGGLSGNGSVTNGFGNASAGSTGNATNTIGQNNGSGVVTNSMGTGSGVTNTYIGNNNPQSTVQLDGGASRMTLNGNGATFSNPATGGPIQVHGVADGTSPNDAVNVRQAFGAVATAMATLPQYSYLKPGESGLGVGTGSYGGYSAMGISFSSLTTNGIQLNVGVARGLQGGTHNAVRAGLGWKF